jgi:hypothetical protein
MANTIETAIRGQMFWKCDRMAEDRTLHLRHHSSEPWRPYQDFPQYCLPDPPGFSQGYATFMALLKQGWVAEPVIR